MNSMASLQQRLMKLELNLRQENESSRRRSVDTSTLTEPPPGHGIAPGPGRYSGGKGAINAHGQGSRTFQPLAFGSSGPKASTPVNINLNNANSNSNTISNTNPSAHNLIRHNPTVNAQCLSPRPRPKALPIGNFGSPGRPQSPSRHPKPNLVFGGGHMSGSIRTPSSFSPSTGDENLGLSERFRQNNLITFDGRRYRCCESDLEYLMELGSGSCGHVGKMLHTSTGKIVAVKQMRRSGNEDESKRIAMDLDVLLKCYACDHIVQCYGYLIKDTEVWICMELMATCFDKLLKRLKAPIPEPILGKVSVATVKALNYLKENHGVIHRDVKPSNILLNEQGVVKLCDFGISGRLVDSKAKTRQAGCAAYMAPERIDPPDPSKPSYDIRADVWSLGISLVELAMGRFPYSECKTDFEVLSKVIQDDPPSLPCDRGFSHEFCDFVKSCLTKDYKKRPKYRKLLENSFIKLYEEKPVDVGTWFASTVTTVTSSEAERIEPGNGCSAPREEPLHGFAQKPIAF